MQDGLRKIDVFIDIESLGMARSASKFIDRLISILSRLRPSLEAKGYEIQSAWAASGYALGREKYRQRIGYIFAKYKVKMVWSEVRGPQVADKLIITEMSARLKLNTMAPAVLLITSDGDFSGIAHAVRQSKRHLIVAGSGVSLRLSNNADETLHIWNFLGA